MKKIRIAAWLLIIVMALSSVACSKRNASTEIPTGTYDLVLDETTSYDVSETDRETEEVTTSDEESIGENQTEEETQPAIDETENSTEAPTKAPVKPTEESTKKPTETQTQKPTEGQTEAPTQKPTQGQTEAPTQSQTQAPSTGDAQLPTYTVTEFANKLGIGWNLGNQLEASSGGTPNETCWGNPVITENLIKKVKELGFNTIRIPVSYLSKIGSAPNYTINAAWLNRVQEVVDMCIRNDLYVIINIHGDGYNTVQGGWLLCNSSDQTTIRNKFAACWTQIANRFKDYDEHLIFESMNEIFDGTYGNPNATYYSNINALNQIFVDTVRATGGNNASRYLLIPGWNTNISYTAGNYGFTMPTDTVANKIIVSVHFYDPWSFAGEGSTPGWGTNRTDTNLSIDGWGQESWVDEAFRMMYTKFTSKGIPVIIGEMGAVYQSETQENNRAYYMSYVISKAKEYKLVPVIWDNGGKNSGSDAFGIFDRNSLTVLHSKYLYAITGK